MSHREITRHRVADVMRTAMRRIPGWDELDEVIQLERFGEAIRLLSAECSQWNRRLFPEDELIEVTND